MSLKIVNLLHLKPLIVFIFYCKFVEGPPQLRFSINDERAIGVEDLNEGLA